MRILILMAALVLAGCGGPSVTDLGGPGGGDDDDDGASDTTPPVVTISAAPASTSTSGSATFTFSANETATFECRLDTAAFAPCTSPKTVTGIAEGSHQYGIRATDAVGNQSSPVSHAWAVDLIPRYNPDIQAFVSAGCSLNNNACHSAGSGRAIATYAQIVNAATTGVCAGRTRVIPGDLANSLFHTKLTTAPPCGARMPNAGGAGQANIDMVAEWITKGAPEN